MTSMKEKQRKILPQTEEKAVVPQSRHWNDAATNQGMPAATRYWKRQDIDFPLELHEEVQP